MISAFIDKCNLAALCFIAIRALLDSPLLPAAQPKREFVPITRLLKYTHSKVSQKEMQDRAQGGGQGSVKLRLEESG